MTLISTSTKSSDDFGRQIRGATRGLWNDSIDHFTFVDTVISAVQRGYEQAWREGSAICGITPDERSSEEWRVLQREIQFAQGAVLGFADFVEAHKKVDGHKYGSLLYRAELWSNRYEAIVTLARVTSCANRKGTWKLGATKEHCRSCLGFAGRTYRMSVWYENNAFPQGRNLECGGWKCGCGIELTDDRVTPGPFPRSLLT